MALGHSWIFLDTNWKSLLKSHPDLQKKKAVAQQHAHKKQSNKREVWFDDVDEIFLEEHRGCNRLKQNQLVKKNAFEGLTRVVAMDCEMVGTGEDGKDSILARVSVVNHFGKPIYDKYVKPIDEVTDYRTAVSGIRPSDLEKGENFKVVQKEVSDILKNRILVGHAVHNDLQVLFLRHSKKNIRDTSIYQPFKKLFNGSRPSLKGLAQRVLGVKIQDGEHSSVQDAQAAMRLYTLYCKRWEMEIGQRRRPQKNASGMEKKTLERSTQNQLAKIPESNGEIVQRRRRQKKFSGMEKKTLERSTQNQLAKIPESNGEIVQRRRRQKNFSGMEKKTLERSTQNHLAKISESNGINQNQTVDHCNSSKLRKHNKAM